jgi:hypothetical protein
VWLSVDQHDNDPSVLLTDLATALDQVERVDPMVFGALARSGASVMATVVPLLGPLWPRRHARWSWCSTTSSCPTASRAWMPW